MKYLFIILTLLFFTTLNLAQENLLPNGSFEEYYNCPSNNELGQGDFNQCKGWWYTTPTQIGTPDYYNACNNQVNGGNGVVGVPNNFWGYQNAFDGDGYIGMVMFVNQLDNEDIIARELVQCKLKSTLKECFIYTFSIRCNIANKSTHGTDGLSLLLSKDSIVFSELSVFDTITPTWTNKEVIVDSVGWSLLSGEFIATGGEEYLTISYFGDFQDVTMVINDTNSINQFEQNAPTFYIDSVRIVEKKMSENCEKKVDVEPNVFTPNLDGKNDNIDFSIYNYVEIMNRWGTTVYKTNVQSNFQWYGKNFRDEDLPAGVYFYIATIAGVQKTGTIHLIR